MSWFLQRQCIEEGRVSLKRALAKNEVKHNIFAYLSVVQIFLAGSFVAFRLTAAYSNSQRSLTVRRAQIGPFLSKETNLAQRQPQTTNPDVGKVWVALGQKTTENLKPQPESKLLLSTIRVALGEKNMSVMTLCIT